MDGTCDFASCGGLEDEVRVVLLGKTGSGKSSLGNTLIGKEEFDVTRGMCSGTDKCQHAQTRRQGLNLHVTDTPGVCDTHRSEAEVLKEVGKSLAVAAPGPHVILMVLRCDRRFTQEEYDAYVTLKCLFGEDICKHMIITFVGTDTFGDDVEAREAGLKRAVETAPPLLRRVLEDAKGRYCGSDNLASPDQREEQAQILLASIQTLIAANHGRHFSSNLLEQIDEHVQTVVMERMRNEGLSFRDAVDSTRLDIVQEKTEPGFFRKLLDIVGNTVLPALKVIFEDAVVLGRAAVALYCSVM